MSIVSNLPEPGKMRLPDGRLLAWLEVGDPDGRPVMFFHGGADSRLESLLLADAARRQGVRLIAAERPGFGLSDPLHARTVLGWAEDVSALASQLKLDAFDVMGHSAGGPYALAVAVALPDHVRQVVVVAGAAPWAAGARGMWFPLRLARLLAVYIPALHRAFLRKHRRDLENPDHFIQQYSRISRGDGALFAERPDIAAMLVADMREGYRQGVTSASYEANLYFGTWEFELADVRKPTHLFYGTDDANVAPTWGAYLHAHLPHANLNTCAGEGHISILVNQAERIFSTLQRAHSE